MAMPNDVVIGRHIEAEINAAFKAALAGDNQYFTPEMVQRPDGLHRSTRRGINAAKITSAWIQENILKGESFDAHFTSGFLRACETAGHLDLPGAQWEVSPFLYERDWGAFLGKTPDKEAEYKETFEKRRQDPWHWRPDGGATLAEGMPRIYLFILERLRSYAGKRVYVSCHGETAWKFRFVFEWMTPEDFRKIHFSGLPEDQIHNCTLLHYTRRHPETGIIGEHLEWMRVVTPPRSLVPTPWRPIGRKLYSGQELLAMAEHIPRLLPL